MAVFKDLENQDIWDWPTMISANLMAQQYFFIGVVMQLTFLSNGLWLTDYAHRVQVFFETRYHNYKYKHSVLKPPFKDTYEFSLGFH